MPSRPLAVPLAFALAAAASAPAQQWTFLDGPIDGGRMAAFDLQRGRVVRFDFAGTTWESGAGTLLHRPVVGQRPAPRTRAAMVYDPLRARIVMYGGADVAGVTLDETWTFDGMRWTQLAVPGPPARVDAAVCFDLARDRIVLFGGSNLPAGFHVDTWEFDGAQWAVRTTPAYPGALPAVVTHDVVRGVSVLVAIQPTRPSVAVHTWEWDGVAWTRIATVGPIAGGVPGLVYDPLRARTVLFGGVGNTALWEWDGVAWRQATVAPTPERLGPAAYYDSSRGRAVFDGGNDVQPNVIGFVVGSARSDEWTWDGATLQQTRADVRPPSRSGHLLVGDPARGEVVLFGGQRNQVAVDDMWTWDGTSWSERSPATRPPARIAASSAFDPVRQEVLVFGGSRIGGLLNDLWAWNGVDWRQLDAGTGPGRRFNASLAFDAANGTVVLFGGSSAAVVAPSTVFGDTWVWNGTAWTRATGPGPAAREGGAMAFDAATNRVVLFGGRNGTAQTQQFGDTWEWNGTAWQGAVTSPTAPGALLQPTLLYDAPSSRLLLLGTRYAPPSFVTEIWSLANGTWTLLDQETGLHLGGPRAIDPVRGTIVCDQGHGLAEWSPAPAQVTSVGTGCGTPVPELAARTRPRLGEPEFGLATRAGPFQPVLFAVADTAATVPLGSGCTLHVGGTVAVRFVATPFAGIAETIVPIPLDASLRGLVLFAQAAALDPAAPNGYRLTQGLQLVVGD